MLMKKALSATSKIQANLTILSFFIHGRGSNLQKPAYGLYRSLLHQLYSLFPHKFLDLTGAFELRQKKHTDPLALNGTGFLERSDSSFSQD